MGFLTNPSPVSTSNDQDPPGWAVIRETKKTINCDNYALPNDGSPMGRFALNP